MNGTVTPIQTPEQVLAAASSEQLLDEIVKITHVIHATPSQERANELRTQRGLLRAEVLRRIGGAR